MTTVASDKRAVVFLGAGASKHFGGRLTREILPEIMSRVLGNRLFGDPGGDHDRREFVNCLSQLMPGIVRVSHEHILVTEVLSLIDFLLHSNAVPAPSTQGEQLRKCRMLLERAILEVLEWPYDPGNPSTISDELRDLARWAFDVGRQNDGAAMTIISTNYDEIIETSVYWQFIDPAVRSLQAVNENISFGVSWRDCETQRLCYPPSHARYSVLKLHGSVNWLKCDVCDCIVCNDKYTLRADNYFLESFKAQGPDNACTCGHHPLRPVVVTPSLVRDVRDSNIIAIWKAAFEEMRLADHWFFIGYSLPIEDYVIRSMLVRAIKTRRLPPSVEVFQMGHNCETEARYRAFFGDGCSYHIDGMQGFLDRIIKGRALL